MQKTQRRGWRRWGRGRRAPAAPEGATRRGMRTRSAELEQELAGECPPVLIDVRGRSAYEAEHLPGAVHVPLTKLVAMAARLDRCAPTVVY
jgi:rhodanese-related sulfurtransferase